MLLTILTNQAGVQLLHQLQHSLQRSSAASHTEVHHSAGRGDAGSCLGGGAVATRRRAVCRACAACVRHGILPSLEATPSILYTACAKLARVCVSRACMRARCTHARSSARPNTDAFAHRSPHPIYILLNATVYIYIYPGADASRRQRGRGAAARVATARAARARHGAVVHRGWP